MPGINQCGARHLTPEEIADFGKEKTPKGHAVLSPSSASRWLACTPSARLEAELPQNNSVYADEGTLWHRLSELIIKKRTGRILDKVYKKELKAIQADELYTGEMQDHAEGFATYILEMFNSYKGSAILFTEDQVDLTRWVPDGFGTVDIRMIAGNALTIIDGKYGKGVPVFADQNKQLMLYALGAYEEMAHLYDIRTVKMIVYQPRIENVSTYELPAEKLLLWAELELVRKAKAAYEGTGDFVPGAHCQFCKVKPTCKALASYNLDLAKEVFKDDVNPVLLTPEEIAEVLKREKFFTDWLTAVSDYALDRAVNHGVSWPGMKLVEGISRRKITDEDKAANALLTAGLSPNVYYKPAELKGITDLTKLLGKSDFEKIVGPFIHKPPGKPVLVPETDKRAAFSSADRAKEAFVNE